MQPLEMKKLPTSYSFGIFDGYVFSSLRMRLYGGLTRIHLPQDTPIGRPDVVRGAAPRHDGLGRDRRRGRLDVGHAARAGRYRRGGGRDDEVHRRGEGLLVKIPEGHLRRIMMLRMASARRLDAELAVDET